MKKILNKINQCFSFERKNSVSLKNVKTKSYGRTMLETLAVLMVIGVLTYGGVKGLGIASTKAQVNRILDDAAEVHTVLSMSKKLNEKWILALTEDKSKSGFNFLGQHTFRKINEDSNPFIVTYVRVTLPKALCEAILENQSDRLSFYKANPRGEVSTKPLTTCEEENDMIFIFNMANACTSDKQCMDKYGKNYICLDNYCSRKQCQTDEDCEDGETCISGACKSESGCKEDSQCAENQICLSGVCTKICESDNDCRAGEKCNVETGVCSSGCSFNTDCPAGYKCSFGTCVTDTEYKKCKNSADCAKGEYCYQYSCETCGTGKYWNSKQQTCMDCPSGASCDGADGSCDDSHVEHYKTSDGTLSCCSRSLYWDGNECTDCPAGGICNGTDEVTCPDGKYAADLSRCLSTDADHACTNWDSVFSCCLDEGRCTCRSCCKDWNGEFGCCMDSGCSTGEMCGTGYVSHGGYRGALRCCHATKEYWNGDNCSTCPEGCACDGTNNSCFDSSCPGGSGWNGAQTVCCQAGEVLLQADHRGDYICCPEGTPFAIDKNGHYGKQHQDYVCAKICQGGTYRAANGSECLTCPAGTYSETNSTSCTNCPAGTYSEAGSAVCTPCPAGSRSASGAETCTECPIGTYSESGSESCTECPEGTYNATVGAGSCTECPAGTYNTVTGAQSAQSCALCPIGTYSNAGADGCINCPDGTFGTVAGAAECESCPAHATCNNNVITCDEGYTPDGNSCLCSRQSCCKNWNTEFGCCKDNGCTAEETCENGYVAHGGFRGVLRCCHPTQEYWNGDNCAACPEGCTCDGTNNSCYDRSCPGGGGWNGIEMVCCQEGEVLLRAGSRNDYICCPEGTPYAIDKTGLDTSILGHQDYTCGTCSSLECCQQNGFSGFSGGKCTCSSNQYVNPSNNSCANCPSNATCDGVTRTCKDNKVPNYTVAGALVCCASNKIFQSNGNYCPNCPTGYTCNGTDTVTGCAEGYVENRTSSGGIVCCAPDKYFQRNGNYCPACPTGYTCNGTDTVTDCAEGYVKNHTSSGGIVCCAPNRYFQSNGNSCPACPTGYVCNGRTTVGCTSDRVKHERTDGSVQCCTTTQYFNNSTGYCTACPGGYTCDGTNIVGCTSDRVKHERTDGSVQCCTTTQYFWNNTNCQNCPNGQTCDGTNIVGCTSGHMHVKSNGAVVCCTTSQYFNTTSQSCTACDDLYRGTTATNDDCKVCSDRTVEFGYCDWICPLGWFRNTNGNCTRCTEKNAKATSITECNKCYYTGSPHVRTYEDGLCKY